MRKKYNIIYADPPWKYRDKCAAGKRGAVFKYSVLSKQDLLELPVENLAADRAVLFLWATGPFMPNALDLLAAWGFEYSTVAFVWMKENRRVYWVPAGTQVHQSKFMCGYWHSGPRTTRLQNCAPCFPLCDSQWDNGMGHTTMANAEFCLVGYRGKRLYRESRKVHQIVAESATVHSKKPWYIRNKITQLFGNLPRIELFATEQAPGWDAMGYEINGKDIREELNVPSTAVDK